MSKTALVDEFRCAWAHLDARAQMHACAHTDAKQALFVTMQARGLRFVTMAHAAHIGESTLYEFLTSFYKKGARMPRKSQSATTESPALVEEFSLAWQAITTQEAQQVLDTDMARATCLADFEARGLTQRDMAEAAQLSQVYIGFLLRYQRFLITAVIKIPEFRFRQYWRNLSDAKTLQSLRGPVHAADLAQYEATVFAQIAAKITAGAPPARATKPEKPATAENILKVGHGNVTKTLQALRKEVTRAFYARGGLNELLLGLEKLLHADRASYSPSGIADRALVLRREMHRVMKLIDSVTRIGTTQSTADISLSPALREDESATIINNEGMHE